MAQNQNIIDGGMIPPLSSKEDGGLLITPHPNLTSRTPPPPGFADGSNTTTNSNSSSITTNTNTIAIDRSETPKSTSFNNLAMALGTGLAESMDDSTTSLFAAQFNATGGLAANGLSATTLLNQQHHPPSSLAAAAAARPAPQRIHTPDTYSRQSRHSVSRLAGSSSSVVGGGSGPQFD